MTDLISRAAVLKAMTDFRLESGPISTAAYSAVEALPAIKPQVVANISGGLLQGASSDHPVDLYTLDFDDIPSDDPENKILLDGDEVFIGQTSTEIDPVFVRSVVEAPTLNERVDCANCDWFGTVDDVIELKDPLERVMPGETMPAGECPECGAVAHLYITEDE